MSDKRISELQSATSVASEDLLNIVDNPIGTPVNKKITVKNFFGSVPANTTFQANVSIHGSMVVSNNNIRITESQTPANSTIAVSQGAIFWDEDYIYIAVSNNVVKRAALSSF